MVTFDFNNLNKQIMKKSSFIFSIAFVLLSTFSALAQQSRDSKGHLILNAKGDIYFDGVKTGTVSKDKMMGKMGKDGKTYFDEKGNIIFTIEDFDKETCNIKDAKGAVIGNVHKSLKGVACALHCFQNQMDMKTHSKH
jgi:hypothetical protein